MAKVTRGDNSLAERLDSTTGDLTREQDVAMETESDDVGATEDGAEDPSGGALVATGRRALATGGSARAEIARTGPPAFLMRSPLTRFLVESYLELRHNVTWPTPRDAWNMTLIVVAVSAFIALLLGGVDLGLARALTYIVGIGTGAK